MAATYEALVISRVFNDKPKVVWEITYILEISCEVQMAVRQVTPFLHRFWRKEYDPTFEVCFGCKWLPLLGILFKER